MTSSMDISRTPALPNSVTIRNRPLWAAGTLCWRECVRFFRQRNRVIGAVGQPILFWLLFGAGMNQMFQVQQQSFSEYYFPGTMVLILLFTAIFATISIIEDRREGFLQSVLVAPGAALVDGLGESARRDSHFIVAGFAIPDTGANIRYPPASHHGGGDCCLVVCVRSA